MRRHFCLLERHVLANNWVVLLELQLALHRALVLSRVVRKAGTGGRNEADVVTHSGPLVPRRQYRSKRMLRVMAGRRKPANGVPQREARIEPF
jgi:hypothetical protein